MNNRLTLPWPPSKYLRRYVAIGLSVYLFELLIIVAAKRAGAGNLVAVSLSFWLGLIVSFGLQKIITFGDKRLHHRVLLPQFTAVCGLVLFNYFFTLLVTNLLDSYISVLLCRTLALSITTIWNFYLYKRYIFKAHE